MTPINPQALKYYRSKRNLSQAELAAALRCTDTQVSRWETGKSGRLRKHLREGLAEVLKVEWEALTRPPQDKSDAPSELEAILPQVAISARVDADCANALRLVAHRYSIDQREILQMAPLLFTVAAERSLRWRKERLERVEKRAAEFDLENAADIAHLPPTDASAALFEHLHDERKSIAIRDVFGATLLHDIDAPDPFVNFLKAECAGLSRDAVSDINANFAAAPAYHVAWDTLQEVTGITVEGDPRDNSILNGFACGLIDLRSALAFKKDHTQDEFEEWCREALLQYQSKVTHWAEAFDLEVTP